MKKWKKWISVLLTGIIMFSVVGCSSQGQSSTAAPSMSTSETQGEAETLEPMTLNVVFPYINKAPEDIAMVEQALSEISQSKINATVKLVPIAYGSWNEQFNLMMSGTEQIDLIFSGMTNTSLSSMVTKGYFIEMDDLLEEHGRGILQQVGNYMVGGKVNGKTYSIPTLRDLATSAGMMFRKSIVDKYDLDLDSVKEWSDLTDILAMIKAGEGENFYPMFLNGSQYTSLTSVLSDPLGEGLGTLKPNADDGEVINRYESEEYRELLDLIHSWYEAGYINRDAATTSTLWQEAAGANAAACWPNNMKPGQVENQAIMLGEELVGVHIGQDIVTTASLQAAMWSIPYQAADPERSMMLLELMWTDEEFFNTLCWGIEGTHYVKTDDGHITYPEGVDAQSTGWGINMGWALGNQFLSYLWEGNALDLWERTKEYNDSANLSVAAGFVFDSANVKNEYAACLAVKNEYVRAIETGSVDLTKLDEMNEKMYASGLQKIVEEKQTQLDAYLKN